MVEEVTVQDHIDTLESHLADSDADQEVHDALAAVKEKVESLELGAETDAKAVEVKAEAGAKVDADMLHAEISEVKEHITKSDRCKEMVPKLEALLVHLKDFIAGN